MPIKTCLKNQTKKRPVIKFYPKLNFYLFTPKTFDVKIDKLKNMDVLQSGNDKKILNKLIFGHLCTEGVIDSALEFAKEAGVDVPPNIDSIYTKMQQLNTEIMECNVENAIEYLETLNL